MGNTLGGWVGAAESFQNAQLSRGGAFNPLGIPGKLGSWIFDRSTPWGPDSTYQLVTITRTTVTTGPSIADKADYQRYLQWLRDWATPPSHPAAPQLSVPSATLECGGG